MSDAQFVLAILLVAPGVILVGVAMLRGYHVLLRIYRPGDSEEHDHPHSDHHREQR